MRSMDTPPVTAAATPKPHALAEGSKVHVVANPRSAGGATSRRWDELLAALNVDAFMDGAVTPHCDDLIGTVLQGLSCQARGVPWS